MGDRAASLSMITVPGTEIEVRRAHAIGAGVALLVLILILLNIWLTNEFGPDTTARDFIAAEGRNDAGGMWDRMLVRPTDVPPQAGVGSTQPSSVLLTKDGLNAALGIAANRHGERSALQAVESQGSDASRQVTMAYMEGGVERHDLLLLQKSPEQHHLGIYPVWQVVRSASVVVLDVPKGAGAVSVDGIYVSTPKVSVFEVVMGRHRVETRPTGFLQKGATEVDTQSASSQGVTVAQVRPAVRKDRESQVFAAVLTAFKKCVSSVSDSNCPDLGTDLVSWELVGDPTKDARLSASSSGIRATGTFTAIRTAKARLSYFNPQTRSSFASDYLADVDLVGDQPRISSISGQKGDPKPGAPPAGSDSKALAAAKAGLAACLGSTSLAPDNCPFGYTDVQNASGVKWSLLSDPTANATVSLGGSGSVETLVIGRGGKVAATFDGDCPPYGDCTGGGHHTREGGFDMSAHLLWDPTKNDFIVVFIY